MYVEVNYRLRNACPMLSLCRPTLNVAALILVTSVCVRVCVYHCRLSKADIDAELDRVVQSMIDDFFEPAKNGLKARET
jgi:hypothetical protein